MKFFILLILLTLPTLSCSTQYGSVDYYSRNHNFEVMDNVVLSFPAKKNLLTGATILAYRRLGDRAGATNNTEEELFKKQMKYLKDNNFKVKTLNAIIDDIRNEKSIDKTVAITFDGAYTKVVSHAHPILQNFNFPYTLFVSTDHIGKGSYMSWGNLKTLTESPLVTIGNLSHLHQNLVNQSRDQINKDISVANQIISERLGIVPTMFAYPYGEADNRIVKELKSMGFKAAFTLSGSNFRDTDSSFLIPRFPQNDIVSKMVGTEKTGFELKLFTLGLPLKVLSPKKVLKGGYINNIIINVSARINNNKDLKCYIDGKIFKTYALKNSPNTFLIKYKKLTTKRRTRMTCVLLGAVSNAGEPLRLHWKTHIFLNKKKPETSEN